MLWLLRRVVGKTLGRLFLGTPPPVPCAPEMKYLRSVPATAFHNCMSLKDAINKMPLTINKTNYQ